MIKARNIAVEVFCLGDEYLTGVGNVVLNYLQELQRVDTVNRYYLYCPMEVKHLKLWNDNWSTITYKTLGEFYPSKRFTNEKLQYQIDYLNSMMNVPHSSRGLSWYLRRVYHRLIKMVVTTVDSLLLPLLFMHSFNRFHIDTYVATKPEVFPFLAWALGGLVFYLPFPVFLSRRPYFVSMLYDFVWKLYPETVDSGYLRKLRLVCRRYLNKSDAIVSISNNVKNEAQRILRKDKRITAIPLACDKTIFRVARQTAIKPVLNKYSITKDYVLSISTVEPRKNIETLIESFRLLKERHDMQLVLVGMKGWKTSKLYDAIAMHEWADDIILTGFVPAGDLSPLYTGARLFCFCSHYEGFGLPVLEAMQCGCPVVSSNSSSLPEVVGDAGILVEPNDAHGFARAMASLVTNRKLRADYVRRGLARADEFSWEKSARSLHAVITSPGKE